MAMIEEARICIRWYLVGFLILFIPWLHSFIDNLVPLKHQLIIILVIYIAITNLVILSAYHKTWHKYHVAVRALALGQGLGLSIMLALSDSSFRLFGWYVAALAFFHCSEYLITALTNPKTLTLESFLLDHSIEYHVAAAMSLLEFAIEWYFVAEYKSPNWLSIFGLCMVVSGEFLRKLSMATAGKSFNHYVQNVRQQDHVLVTSGIYSYFRHPSYVGWFYWSIGTQIMLCNPVCFLGYAYASWKFFNSRIYHEEIALLHFFGEDYVEYQKKVPTGLPFIKGYMPKL